MVQLSPLIPEHAHHPRKKPGAPSRRVSPPPAPGIPDTRRGAVLVDRPALHALRARNHARRDLPFSLWAGLRGKCVGGGAALDCSLRPMLRQADGLRVANPFTRSGAGGGGVGASRSRRARIKLVVFSLTSWSFPCCPRTPRDAVVLQGSPGGSSAFFFAGGRIPFHAQRMRWS